MTMSPTQLSLRHLRELGYTAEVVERRIPHTNTTRDLLGFIDILAIGPPVGLVNDRTTLAVQTTTVKNVPARLKKIAECDHIAAVREAGWAISVHGWAKKNGRWILAREVDVS